MAGFVPSHTLRDLVPSSICDLSHTNKQKQAWSGLVLKLVSGEELQKDKRGSAAGLFVFFAGLLPLGPPLPPPALPALPPPISTAPRRRWSFADRFAHTHHFSRWRATTVALALGGAGQRLAGLKLPAPAGLRVPGALKAPAPTRSRLPPGWESAGMRAGYLAVAWRG